jgi:hypothetical protein
MNQRFAPVKAVSLGLHLGDFRELPPKLIADNSVQLVFTDPPYDGDAVPLYGAAAAEAERILSRVGPTRAGAS